MRQSTRLQASKGSPTSSSKRSPNLHLPGLPRFHPANFSTGSSALTASSTSTASQPSSTATSPPSAASIPQASLPVRPQYHARQYSDAQRQLYAYQRELMLLNQYSGMAGRRPQSGTHSPSGQRRSPHSPRSPRLHPLGSPGPVTPFELEADLQSHQRDGYLFGGPGMDSNQLSEEAKNQILDTFIQKETAEAARSTLPPTYAQHPQSYPYAAATGMHSSDHTSHRSALSR